MAETVRKETLMMKPVETWYRERLERWTAAKENGKKDLEVLHLAELQTGPGDLTLVEWEKKMAESEIERHGSKRAYDAVYGGKVTCKQ